MTPSHFLPADMLATAITAPGGPEQLVASRHPLPAIGSGDILIRMAAAGVNGPDLAQRRGHYDPPPGASPLPGLEVSGTVSAVGADVSNHKVGDAVMALTNGGGYAEYVAVPAGQVLPVPQGWSFAEAAALPETWYTVTQTLVMRAGLEAGMSVLVHGASGGIGGAAIQIAGLLGARAIGVTSTPEKAAYAKAMGAHATIDRSEDIAARAKELTNGKGVDRVVDVIGGDMAGVNVAASARNGHIVQISTLDGGTAAVPLRLIMAKGITLSGSTLRPQDSATKRAIAERVATFLPALAALGWRKPDIRLFDLENAAEAHAAMEGRGHIGKLVLLSAYGRESAADLS
ncbi:MULTISPECIES: NAD(P)H-quinone oxidoreductase [unclassified Devosia]|uniref:NAD(P)H-quinone oxidoreductase n=1 Tax=unclassified Devosia TaxID=196773 RepID=UPI0023D8179A|nr:MULTISPECIES: NAD(P)H-quinone oxidoreductase [unclassified Devosia]WEJ32863.1 NAD(P)H-quinone oxidoreductase [Devosia sp. SD17-2]